VSIELKPNADLPLTRKTGFRQVIAPIERKSNPRRARQTVPTGSSTAAIQGRPGKPAQTIGAQVRVARQHRGVRWPV
jgi:hypothetical protein